MSVNKEIMIIGAKESFLIRVLIKKSAEAGLQAFYIPPELDRINASWEKTGLVTVYLEGDEKIKPELWIYLQDRLREDNRTIILIGDKVDTEKIRAQFEPGMIAKVFSRPLDNAKYIETASEQLLNAAQIDNRKSILIVDDDPTYIGLIRDWLKDRYKVSMAASGLQAIKWLGKNHADLILLDHEMPVTSGPQVLEMLRSDPETKYIPVIFLTGKSDKASVMQVVALKPQGYLLKTISREELLEELDKFFSGI